MINRKNNKKNKNSFRDYTARPITLEWAEVPTRRSADTGPLHMRGAVAQRPDKKREFRGASRAGRGILASPPGRRRSRAHGMAGRRKGGTRPSARGRGRHAAPRQVRLTGTMGTKEEDSSRQLPRRRGVVREIRPHPHGDGRVDDDDPQPHEEWTLDPGPGGAGTSMPAHGGID